MRFPLLTPSALEGLAAAIRKARLTPPWSAGRVGEYVSRAESQAVVEGLTHLTNMELTPRQIAHVLGVMAEDRRAVQAARDRLELVWSGPEQVGSGTRETSVVVRELFRTARRMVLISSYGLDHGEKAEHLFRPLAENMAAHPELRVRLYLNVRRPMDSVEADDVLLCKFAGDFRHKVWPWERLPEVYYDLRSLAPPSSQRACLHAKCVAVDDERAFITSANFTEAAQVRNIEAGVLITDRNVARALRCQFESLVEGGILKRLEGVG